MITNKQLDYELEISTEWLLTKAQPKSRAKNPIGFSINILVAQNVI